VLWEQVEQAPLPSSAAKRAPGVKCANFPDPEDYDAKLEAMTVYQTLELGMNHMHKVGCALYITHMYNHTVVDTFLADECVGAERKEPLKERMATSVN